MILRFDCRTINDIVTFRVGRDRKEHWIIAACNDGFLRVFSLKNLLLVRVIKGLGGSPTCIDVAKTIGSERLAVDTHSHRDLVAVGYQDNSFVVYSILQGFKPLYRGLEHRSFVCQVRFDNYYMRRQEQYLANEEEHKNAAFEGNLDVKEINGIGAEDVDVKLKATRTQSRLARSSKNRLIDLLRRNTSRSMIE